MYTDGSHDNMIPDSGTGPSDTFMTHDTCTPLCLTQQTLDFTDGSEGILLVHMKARLTHLPLR